MERTFDNLAGDALPWHRGVNCGLRLAALHRMRGTSGGVNRVQAKKLQACRRMLRWHPSGSLSGPAGVDRSEEKNRPRC